MIKQNENLELGAVKLLDVQPDHKILEVGFGPGVGIRAAYDKVRGTSMQRLYELYSCYADILLEPKEKQT